MIGLTLKLSTGAALILGLATVAAEPPAPKSTVDPIATYEEREAHGFKVMLSKQLPNGNAIFRSVESRLKDIVRVVPAAHLRFLRDVTVWIVSGDDGKLPASIFENTAAFYVRPDRERDPFEYGLPNETEGGVVIFGDRFLSGRMERWAAETVPGWLLHEMAHALHDRVLGFDYPPVKSAYRKAMDRRLYDEVDTHVFHDLGQFRIERRPAYARTNHCEYFAELSIAYLNLPTEYYPFTRDDLADHDPGGYALMDGFWRPVKCKIVNEFPFPVSIDRLAESRRRFRLCDLMPGKETAFDWFEGMSLVAMDQRDGRSYRANRPDNGGRTWRLAPETTSYYVDLSTFLRKSSR
jgi:hypothetical protein